MQLVMPVHRQELYPAGLTGKVGSSKVLAGDVSGQVPEPVHHLCYRSELYVTSSSNTVDNKDDVINLNMFNIDTRRLL
jgi:hypothetical protein